MSIPKLIFPIMKRTYHYRESNNSIEWYHKLSDYEPTKK
jgi:hypothetical protein